MWRSSPFSPHALKPMREANPTTALPPSGKKAILTLSPFFSILQLIHFTPKPLPCFFRVVTVFFRFIVNWEDAGEDTIISKVQHTSCISTNFVETTTVNPF